jgi:hypothetical protein
VRLDDGERAAELYQLLLPFRDQIAGAAACHPLEPVAHALGAIALRSNNTETARDHLLRALELAQDCRNEVWIDRIRADLARCSRPA